MKATRLVILIALFFLLKTFLGCTESIYVPKESPSRMGTLFLIHNRTVDPIGVVDLLLKEIRLMGYEAQDLRVSPAQNENTEEDQFFYGSGFFISKDGLLITAHHVIEWAETIIIKKINGDSFRAKVLLEDPVHDIAVLSGIGEQKADYWLPLGNYHNAHIGEEIKVVGYPVPDLVGTKPMLAEGFISSDAGIGGDPTRFEISAPLNLGCSGAAILNRHNEVIGIASEQSNDEWVLLTRAGPLPPDINFAVKINYAKKLLDAFPGKKLPQKISKSIRFEDAVKSTALVLINTQKVPAAFHSKQWNRIILVEFSRMYMCYIIQYTLFEFNNRRDYNVSGEVSNSGYIGGTPVSHADEMVEALIKELRTKTIL